MTIGLHRQFHAEPESESATGAVPFADSGQGGPSALVAVATDRARAARGAIPDAAIPRFPVSAYRRVGKRAMDILFVLVSLPVTVPVLAVLVALLALSGGSPLFGQRRVGRDGRIFTMWKLRTMVPDAEAHLDRHLSRDPALRAEWDRTQKLRHDPRITAAGAILRKTSLDELPQIWNVLRGDMSLVGPRPMLPDQQPLYPGTAYFRLRPGLTGLWQVSDRNQTDFARRADFDTVYDGMLSPALDLRIMVATLGVVVRGTGC